MSILDRGHDGIGPGSQNVMPIGPQWRDVKLGDETTDDLGEGDEAGHEVALF